MTTERQVQDSYKMASMSQSAVFLVALIGVQCLGLAAAQNFCDDETNLFLSNRSDVNKMAWTVVQPRTALDLDLDRDRDVEPQVPSGPDAHRTDVRAGAHDLVQGDCVDADVYDKYNFTDCTEPGTGNATSYYVIRFNGNVEMYCIRILDTVVNADGEDLGGYPFIDDNGIGFDTVEIRLVSQEGLGMKFLIEIYTRVLENTLPPSSTGKTV